MTTVGWYVHHHGHGHRTRLSAVRPHLDADVVVFSSLAPPAVLPPRTEWVVLPRDDDGTIEGDPTAGGMLHWAPLGHAGHRRRLAAIAEVAAARELAVMVVDVSAEVAVFARLLGVPVIVMAQPGERTDAPHELAYRLAERAIAPWARGVGTGALPRAAADRIVHVGGISRFDGRPRDGEPVPGTVFVLGDTPVGALSDWDVSAPTWVDDPWPALCRAEVVVSAAGQNAVADLAAAGVRAVVVPQPRPFGEQEATGALLAKRALAVVAAQADAAALAAARGLDPDWSEWEVAGAAARAAAVIAEVAGIAEPALDRAAGASP